MFPIALLFCLPLCFQSPAIAIDGYDPVAYFTQSDAVPGKNELYVDHGGKRWLFSSAAHAALFAKNPEQYMPQYDGTCAYAASENYVYSADPRAWSIVDGRLFFNYSMKVRELWSKNRDERIKSADANWPSLKTKSE